MKLTLLPWGENKVGALKQDGEHLDVLDSRWKSTKAKNVIEFKLAYPGHPGTSVGKPPSVFVELIKSTGEYLTVKAPLLSTIVSPNVVTQEWFKLHDPSAPGEHVAEILLHMWFELEKTATVCKIYKDPKNGFESAFKPWAIASGAAVPIHFEKVPNIRWFKGLLIFLFSSFFHLLTTYYNSS